MQLNPIKKRSMKIMTHLGRILRFWTKLTIKAYFSFLSLRNLPRPSDAPIPINIPIPVMGTAPGSPLGSPGWAKRAVDANTKTTTIDRRQHFIQFTF